MLERFKSEIINMTRNISEKRHDFFGVLQCILFKMEKTVVDLLCW